MSPDGPEDYQKIKAALARLPRLLRAARLLALPVEGGRTTSPAHDGLMKELAEEVKTIDLFAKRLWQTEYAAHANKVDRLTQEIRRLRAKYEPEETEG